MSFALSLQNEKAATNILSNLIVADIAPSIGSLSPEFVRYISAMQKIEALAPGVIKTRTDADKELQPYEQVIPLHYISSLPLRDLPSNTGYICSPIPPYQPPPPNSFAEGLS